MKKVSKSLFMGLYTCKLLSAVINSRKAPPFPPEIQVSELYDYQVSQSVANMTYHSLKELELPYEELKPFEDQYKMHILREARFEIAGNKIFAELDKNNIPFIPLKGVILKKLYGTEAYRSFTDYDIYIGDKSAEVQEVMEKSGFVLQSTTEHDSSYIKRPSINFEMHHKLFDEHFNFGDYFGNPFEKAEKKPDSNCFYLLKNEDFYLHIFCHLFKHFTYAGCGIRHFMDIYVMEKNLKLDKKYIAAELEKLKLTDFYNTVQRLLDVMFKDKKPDDRLLEICNFIFSNKTFGFEKNIAVAEFNKEKQKNNTSNFLWKISFFSKRWGLSYKNMKKQYKILNKCPFLLPFCWINKAFRVLFFKPDVLKSQISDIESYSSDYAEYIAHIKELSGVNPDYY